MTIHIKTPGEIAIMREAGRIAVQTGDPGIPDEDFDAGEIFGQFFVDELDALTFPRSGWSLRLRATAGLEGLGSDEEYRQGTAEGSLALSRGWFTALLGAQAAATHEDDAPFQNRFRLGGFARLSGLEQDELIGQHAGMLLGAFYARLREGAAAAVYAGGTVEYGNVWQSSSGIAPDDGILAGSLFVGVDTPIGPLTLAYGVAEGGRTNYYLSLGQALARHHAGLWNRR